LTITASLSKKTSWSSNTYNKQGILHFKETTYLQKIKLNNKTMKMLLS